MRMKVIVCLPAYEEEENLPALLSEIHETLTESSFPYEIVVVDDGSKDRTAEVATQLAAKYQIRVLRHQINSGLGEALRTGLSAALQMAQDRDAIVTMDADNTHSPRLLLRIIRVLQEGNDVVIASRYVGGANIRGLSLFRRFLSFVAMILFRVVFPTRNVRDYTCGYRAYNVSILRKAFTHYGDSLISQKGFACMVDILLKLRAIDAIMAEVPLVLRYDRKAGMSKMKVLSTIKSTLLLLAKRRLGNYD